MAINYKSIATNLYISGKHKFSNEFEKERIVEFATYIYQSIDALDYVDLMGELIEISFKKNFILPCISIYIHDIGNGSHLNIYKDSFTLGTYYRFGSFVYENNVGINSEYEMFQSFRKKLFDVLNFLGCDYVIYLHDGGHLLHDYLVDLQEGKSFDFIEQKLRQDIGEPITDMSKVTYTGDPYKFYDYLNEYVLDRFDDLRVKQ